MNYTSKLVNKNYVDASIPSPELYIACCEVESHLGYGGRCTPLLQHQLFGSTVLQGFFGFFACFLANSWWQDWFFIYYYRALCFLFFLLGLVALMGEWRW